PFPNEIVFQDEASKIVLRNSASVSGTDSGFIQPLGFISGRKSFGVSWERWDGPLLERRNNLDLTTASRNFDQYGDPRRNDAYFSTFTTSILPNVRGRFGYESDDISGYIGQGDAETTPLTVRTMRF